MNRNERFSNWQTALQALHDGHMAELWTALPCVLVEFNAALQTCSAKVATQVQVGNPDGTKYFTDIPLLVDVPVVFPSGGGYTLTFPMSVGDELLVVFATRCIDSWWEQAQQPLDAKPFGSIPPDLRMHDLSDGFAIPQPRSKPRALSAFNTSQPQLRSDDGATFLELGAGVVTIQGNLHVTGEVIAGFGTVNPIGLQTHIHHAPDGDTGLPFEPPP